MFNNKNILVTGGTGSFGQEFIKYILRNYKPKKIIIFSRDELQTVSNVSINSHKKNYHRVRFFIGDIRSKQRLITVSQIKLIILSMQLP